MIKRGTSWKSRLAFVARADMNNASASMTESGGGSNDEVELILDPRVQESIGRSLKAHYDDIVNAPVPDKFLVLLAQLEAQETRAASGDMSDERL
ncbi:NepR family anti-sigma factor [Bosea vaviloviae]|nr:NepR family anti-sigma factor [Bosea vaviloviae]